jgi:hypothetical protein
MHFSVPRDYLGSNSDALFCRHQGHPPNDDLHLLLWNNISQNLDKLPHFVLWKQSVSSRLVDERPVKTYQYCNAAY